VSIELIFRIWGYVAFEVVGFIFAGLLYQIQKITGLFLFLYGESRDRHKHRQAAFMSFLSQGGSGIGILTTAGEQFPVCKKSTCALAFSG
jgi:hypothetical protein